MTDLEERILKKNVPGKYSQWTDHEEDKAPSRIDDNDDNDSKEESSVFPYDENFQLDIIHSDKAQYERPMHNTGVKGILSDRCRAKELERIMMQEEEYKKEALWKRMTSGSVLDVGEQSISISFQIQQEKNIKKDIHHSDSDSYSDSDCFDQDDGEKDDFFNVYRQKRLSDLLEESSLPRFGCITEVYSAIKYAEFIDEADLRTFLIFHLYDSKVPCCRLMNEHLDQIARDMEYCRFFRIKVSKVKKMFDPIGFPCILLYRAGKEVANLTPIVEFEDRDRFTVQDVEEILMQSCGIRNSLASHHIGST
jgi:hypothetical protein